MQPIGIDLLVPGLLGPMPSLDGVDAAPKATVLERSLSRANVSTLTPKDYASTLFHLFGLSQNSSNDLATAPYCRLADGGQVDDGYWLQLSPVHLQPDGDGLLLFDTAHLGLSLDEAEQLADLVRKHFSDSNWQLELYEPQRWYLSLKQKPDLQTSPLTEVIGRNINAFLPQGGEAMEWHVILNELQMLLHSSKVNMLREGRGRLSINGLWPHGGGSCQAIEQTSYAGVAGDDELLRGIAQTARVKARALPLDSSILGSESEQLLVVYSQIQRSVLDADPYGWVESVENFNRWLGPLLELVRSNRLGYLDIYPCSGTRYRINPSSLRRFWRRSRPLTFLLSD